MKLIQVVLDFRARRLCNRHIRTAARWCSLIERFVWLKPQHVNLLWRLFVLRDVMPHILVHINCTNIFDDPAAPIIHLLSWITLRPSKQDTNLFCTMTNKCTQLLQKLSHSYMFRHYCVILRKLVNQYHAKLHKYFKCSCW